MRDSGPSDKGSARKDGRLTKVRLKPDTMRASLSAQELHAYYIALICSPQLAATRDGLQLRRR